MDDHAAGSRTPSTGRPPVGASGVSSPTPAPTDDQINLWRALEGSVMENSRLTAENSRLTKERDALASTDARGALITTPEQLDALPPGAVVMTTRADPMVVARKPDPEEFLYAGDDFWVATGTELGTDTDFLLEDGPVVILHLSMPTRDTANPYNRKDGANDVGI